MKDTPRRAATHSRENIIFFPTSASLCRKKYSKSNQWLFPFMAGFIALPNSPPPQRGIPRRKTNRKFPLSQTDLSPLFQQRSARSSAGQ